MKKPRLKSVVLPDGSRLFCLHRDEVRGVRAQAQGYFAHGLEIRAGDVVFDVGANIGLFALEAARKGASVHAFEPMSATFAALRANAKRFNFGGHHETQKGSDAENSDAGNSGFESNLENGCIEVLQLALGARAELATFTYFRYLSTLSTRFPIQTAQNARAGVSSVFDNAALTPRAGWFRAAPLWVRRAFLTALTRILFESRVETCRVETVSMRLRKMGDSRIDLLKIDVEGAEMEVLQGIEADDWPKIAQVVAEIHDENGRLNAIQELLKRHGLSEIHAEKEPDAGQFEIYLLWARRPSDSL